MAEGGRDPGVQSDIASETEEHSSPLDTIGSMTQSLMDLRPPKQRGSLAGRKACRRISKRCGALEFLFQYEKRMNNRCTWSVKTLEESTEQPKKVARCEPLLTAPGVGRARSLRWILQNRPHNFDYGDGQPIGAGCPGTPRLEEVMRPRLRLILPTSSEVHPGRPVAAVIPIPHPHRHPRHRKTGMLYLPFHHPLLL